jgi:hypothetical protein
VNNSTGTSETSSGCSSGRSSEACEQEDDERKETANLHDLSNESIKEEDEEEAEHDDSLVSHGYVTLRPAPNSGVSPGVHRPTPAAMAGYTQMGVDGWQPRSDSPPTSLASALPPGYSRASAAFDNGDPMSSVFPVQSQEKG